MDVSGRPKNCSAMASFVSAMNWTSAIGAVVAVGGAIVAFVWMPGKARARRRAVEGATSAVEGTGGVVGSGAVLAETFEPAGSSPALVPVEVRSDRP